MPKKESLPATLSIPQAARFAGVGVPVIKAAIDEGLISVTRLGKRVRVLRVPFEDTLMAGKLERRASDPEREKGEGPT